jgi:hypothetical protein
MQIHAAYLHLHGVHSDLHAVRTHLYTVCLRLRGLFLRVKPPQLRFHLNGNFCIFETTERFAEISVFVEVKC